MNFLSKEFYDFILPQCDRLFFIQNYLFMNGVKSVITPLNKRQHILVQFDKKFYNSKYRTKTLIAHYDRVQNTPGANDNSAAIWQLMNFAVELSKWNEAHNVRIFFTDGEELGEYGVGELGSFGIAQTFKKLNIINDDIFVFDCCGRGTCGVLASNVKKSSTSSFLGKRIHELFSRTESLLLKSGMKYFELPCAYSDNAAFLLNGLPAVCLTLLPEEEALLYLKNKNCEPYSWKLFHTPQDNLKSLTQESFSAMKKFLTFLAQDKNPLIAE